MTHSTERGFVDFTKKIWIQEVTTESAGTTFYLKLKEALEIEEMYYKIKYKYDILYKEVDFENEKLIKALLFVVLLLSIGLNVMALSAIFRSI